MGTITIKSTDPASQGPCVIIEEADFDAAKHERFVPPPPSMVPPPPVVAPSKDDLANLPADWRKKAPWADLQSLAASVSGGRMPENKAQAIEMIEAAITAAGAK